MYSAESHRDLKWAVGWFFMCVKYLQSLGGVVLLR